ncbi:MAG: hypothetical protein K5841_00220 [Fretibacterium sp.]|nr:hypothetical protein [Fretibacterium sp.]
MIMTTPVSCKAALVTNRGTDSSGGLLRGSVGINGLRAGADNDKIFSVASLLAACLAHPVLTITKTETVELSDE